MSATFVTQDAKGLLLLVRLTPKGGRDAVDGPVSLSDGRVALGARVRALPESGEANAALIALLAKTFSIPKSAILLASGATSRLKTLRIAGSDAALLARLEALNALDQA